MGYICRWIRRALPLLWDCQGSTRRTEDPRRGRRCGEDERATPLAVRGAVIPKASFFDGWRWRLLSPVLVLRNPLSLSLSRPPLEYARKPSINGWDPSSFGVFPRLMPLPTPSLSLAASPLSALSLSVDWSSLEASQLAQNLHLGVSSVVLPRDSQDQLHFLVVDFSRPVTRWSQMWVSFADNTPPAAPKNFYVAWDLAVEIRPNSMHSGEALLVRNGFLCVITRVRSRNFGHWSGKSVSHWFVSDNSDPGW